MHFLHYPVYYQHTYRYCHCLYLSGSPGPPAYLLIRQLYRIHLLQPYISSAPIPCRLPLPSNRFPHSRWMPPSHQMPLSTDPDTSLIALHLPSSMAIPNLLGYQIHSMKQPISHIVQLISPASTLDTILRPVPLLSRHQTAYQ